MGDAEWLQRRIRALELAIKSLCVAIEASPCPVDDHGCETPGRQCSVHYAATKAREEIDS